MEMQRTMIRVFLALALLLCLSCQVPLAQAAPFAYITNRNSATVSVIDTASNTVIATVTVGLGPDGVAVTRTGPASMWRTPEQRHRLGDRHRHQYGDRHRGGGGCSRWRGGGAGRGPRLCGRAIASNSVSVINTATDTVTTTVPVGDVPFGVAVTPDGAFVYVANRNSNSVSVIDTADNTVIATVGVESDPSAFGRFIGPLPAVVTIAEVIALFDRAVADGTLTGPGPGNSAQNRLQALRNMLVTAARLLEQGDVDAACRQLQDVANRTDGAVLPPDFVQGPAAVDLFGAVTALREQLGCVD